MQESFEELVERLGRAREAIDVFGCLNPATAESLKQRYRTLVLLAHPDHNPSQVETANQVCQALHQWYAIAQQQIAGLVYGQAPRIRINSQDREYLGHAAAIEGELCDLFPAVSAADQVLLKVVRQARDNDLLQAEARALRKIERELAGQRVQAHFPMLIEHVLLSDESGSRRQVNILRMEKDVVSLADIMRAYPQGIDAADAAWMFKRMLAAIATTHSLGMVHGAVIPTHMLLRLNDHNGILVGWCASVAIGTPLKLRSPIYARDYPPEVGARQPATPATDIFLAASCMVRLLGGYPDGSTLPASVPRPIANLLRACLIPAQQRRPDDAWQLFEDFDEILGTLYGPPRFRHFSMPDRT